MRRHSPNEAGPGVSNLHLLLAYVTDLELEVDRLRKQGQFIQHQVRETLKRVRLLCADAAGKGTAPDQVVGIGQEATHLAAVIRDLQDPPGYHPAHDQVVAIAVRPLIEQVFRWEQRLAGAPPMALRLELEQDHMEWFPARLKHILENLLSNALKYRDPQKAESWVQVGLRTSAEEYELRVSDNGVGLPPDDRAHMFELFYRAAPARAAGLGVGLAIVKLLVEQSGGALSVDSGEGQGATFVVVLPRYDVNDFLV
jgi:signal transduction histidine kinase